MQIIRLYASEVATRGLRGTHRPEFGNKVVLRGLLEGSKLMSVGMGQMLEVERTRDAMLEVMA